MDQSHLANVLTAWDACSALLWSGPGVISIYVSGPEENGPLGLLLEPGGRKRGRGRERGRLSVVISLAERQWGVRRGEEDTTGP